MSDLLEKVTIPVSVVGVGAQASLNGSVRGPTQLDPAVQRFVPRRLEALALHRGPR